MARQDNLTHLMPLTETMFYVLISLLEPLHGYGIMQKVERLSGGRVRMGPGTLYGALNNLKEVGLIAPDEREQDQERRKSYHITPAGRALIALEVQRLEEMIHNARMLLAEGEADHE